MSMNNEQQLRPKMINGRPDPIVWAQSEINDDGSITYQHKYDRDITFRHRHESPTTITRNMPVSTSKKTSTPTKPVTHETVLAALKEHQPAPPDLLRAKMREQGYDLDGAVAVKRMSNIVYRLRTAGDITQHANNVLTLPDYTGPVKLLASKTLSRHAVIEALKQCQPAEFSTLRAHMLDAGYSVSGFAGKKRLSSTLGYLKKNGQVSLQSGKFWTLDAEPEPAAAATPEPEPAPVPTEPQELPSATSATVRCKKISATLGLFDGTAIEISVDADGIATISNGQSQILLSLTELGHITSHLHGLHALLDDPQ